MFCVCHLSSWGVGRFLERHTHVAFDSLKEAGEGLLAGGALAAAAPGNAEAEAAKYWVRLSKSEKGERQITHASFSTAI